MGCVKVGYKSCVIFLALLQVIIAIALLAAGIFVFVSFGNIKEFANATYTLVPASILVAAGVILIVLGAFGFCGACKENKCMLSIFFVLSGALFIIEMVGACLALAMRDNFEAAVNEEYWKFMKGYNTSAIYQEEINWIQKTFECCGSNNATDWTTLSLNVPDSCCSFNSTIPHGKCNADVVLENHIVGCSAKLHNVFFANLNIIGGVGLTFAFVQLIALTAVICLLCRRQEHYEVF